MADGVKLFFKEEFMPASADKFLYILGPSLTMFVALLTSAAIPWGPDLVINGVAYPMQVADVNIGVLYVFAILSIGVYGVMIGGWPLHAANGARAPQLRQVFQACGLPQPGQWSWWSKASKRAPQVEQFQ